MVAASCAAAVPTRPAAVCTEAAAAEPGIRRLWLSIGAVALGAFVLVMTETMPVGCCRRSLPSCGQHKTNTTPGPGKDQHGNNTDKTVLPGTGRHAC